MKLFLIIRFRISEWLRLSKVGLSRRKTGVSSGSSFCLITLSAWSSFTSLFSRPCKYYRFVDNGNFVLQESGLNDSLYRYFNLRVGILRGSTIISFSPVCQGDISLSTKLFRPKELDFLITLRLSIYLSRFSTSFLR